MASIVGAFAMSHQLGAPDGVEEQAERVFQQLRADARERLGDEISRFELALDSQDDRQIRPARERMRKAVGFFERDSHFDPDFVF